MKIERAAWEATKDKKMTNDEYCARLRELCQQVASMLERPEPGLVSWSMMFGNAMNEIADMWMLGRTGERRPDKPSNYEKANAA